MTRTLALLLCGLLATSVSAEDPIPGLMSFEPLQSNGTGFVFPGSVYEEDGYKVTALRLTEFVSAETFNADWFAGSTGLFNGIDGGITRLSNLDEISPFTLTSIDLSRVSLTYPGGATVTFFGLRADDVTTVTQSFTVGDALAFQTFHFGPDFTDLKYVEWSQNGPYHQFDNININGAPQPPSSVPEPMTLAVWSFFALSGMGVVARRRSRGRSRA